jgi:hypothetical protein
MKRISRLSLLLFLFMLTGFSGNGHASEGMIKIHWSQLGTLPETGRSLGRGKAMLVLPNGAVVEGQILEVRNDELVLKVSKSSDQKAYPKGRLSIPRSAVSTIRLTQTKGSAGRIIGTLAGIFGGAGIGTVIALNNEEPGGGARAGVAALWVGTTLAGYYLGRSFDRKTIIIEVLPE